MKKSFVVGLAIGLTLAGASLVLANSQIQAILNSQIKVALNGKVQEFRDETTNEIQYPITYHDRTYLPLRTVANLVGVNVDYNAETQTAILETNANIEDTNNYSVVQVSTVRELLNNIKPYTKIILTGDLYGLHSTDLITYEGENVYFEECFDGYEMIIHDIDHLQICADENVIPELTTTYRYANVLNFKNCNDVKLDGLMMGHDIEKGYCLGGVLNIENSSNIEITNCFMYGCGTYGIISRESNNIAINSSDIYECSYGLVDIANCHNFEFNNCILRDSEQFTMFAMNNCTNVQYKHCTITGNKSGMYNSLISDEGSSNITFFKCLFEKNEYEKFVGKNPVVKIVSCKIINNNQK